MRFTSSGRSVSMMRPALPRALGAALVICSVVSLPRMPAVQLAGNITLPAVSLGTGEYRGQEAFDAVSSALALGYTAIDTAHEYQNQQEVGQAVRAALANASLGLSRTDLTIITKVEGGLTAAETAKRLEEDAEQLNLPGPIDLVLLHFPKAAPFKSLEKTVQDQWGAISAFVAGGGARGAGVSQFCEQCLQYLDGDASAAHVRPVLHQFGWHVGMGKDPQGIATATAARGDCTSMAYSPLAEADPALLSGEPIASIARAHGVSAAQVALRWLWQQGVPYAVAATKPAYQRENIDIFGFTLTTAQMSTLANATLPSGCPFWPGSVCWKESACEK